MTRTIMAHYDGRVLIPEEPVDLPVGQSLRISVETPELAIDRFADLRGFAVDVAGLPDDLAAQHDHYLYGSPKQ